MEIRSSSGSRVTLLLLWIMMLSCFGSTVLDTDMPIKLREREWETGREKEGEGGTEGRGRQWETVANTPQNNNNNISLLSEESLLSPFLAFFSFWHKLKMPVALYIVCKFHDKWTKRNGPKLLGQKVWSHWLTLKVKDVFSFSCKVTSSEIRGFVPTAELWSLRLTFFPLVFLWFFLYWTKNIMHNDSIGTFNKCSPTDIPASHPSTLSWDVKITV